MTLGSQFQTQLRASRGLFWFFIQVGVTGRLTLARLMGEQLDGMSMTFFSRQFRRAVRRYRGRHSSIDTISVNVNRSSRFIVVNLFGIGILTGSDTRDYGRQAGLFINRSSVRTNLFGIRGFTSGQRGDLYRAEASLFYKASNEVPFSSRRF